MITNTGKVIKKLFSKTGKEIKKVFSNTGKQVYSSRETYVMYRDGGEYTRVDFETGPELMTYIKSLPYNESPSLFYRSLIVVNTEPDITDMSFLFRGFDRLAYIDITRLNTDNVTNMEGMFWGFHGIGNTDLSHFYTGSATNMKSMFRECWGESPIDLTSFDTSNVIDMRYMFYNNWERTLIDVTSFNTKNVQYMNSMFESCDAITELDLKNFQINSIIGMEYFTNMFSGNYSLITIYNNDDWNKFDVAINTYMFQGCRALVGAVPYDSNFVEVTRANPDYGYFTRK